ncbi:MAG: hypothetical protein OXP70_06300, partial [Acidobacteriota bacterium]|nr:hypothetical protein [Acidobacteriota bacterium]
MERRLQPARAVLGTAHVATLVGLTAPPASAGTARASGRNARRPSTGWRAGLERRLQPARAVLGTA